MTQHTLQHLFEQKAALNQSLAAIDTQIADALPKGRMTVIEWLQWADANGFDWAKSAIEQCTDEYKQKETARSLPDSLVYFKYWPYTKEGYNYWNNIYKSLKSNGL